MTQYQPTDQEKALYKWLDLVVGGQVTEIRYANQKAARPDRPFVTLQVNTDQESQTPEVKTLDEQHADGTYKQQMTERRTGTVSVNVYGADHKDLIAQIERSLWDPEVTRKNTQNGIQVQRPMSGPQDNTTGLATTFEGRSQQDYQFGYVVQTVSPHGTPIVEKAEATGSIDHPNEKLTVQQTEDDS